ncbi:hypothetical protein B0H16DRAFT_463950 [Mycena metata]|uniref:Uncharacterized protein n=1 Tax=Mycena metata TaxID=1033252 RepID=A0AAD7KDZ5_9AGAR|nr:hypothetical protein B0H16DRAFT_463950 [Mycena metata]
MPTIPLPSTTMQPLSTDVDLCELLLRMKLGRPANPVRRPSPISSILFDIIRRQESPEVDGRNTPLVTDTDISEAPHFDETLAYPRPDSPCEPPFQGCAYLQAIQSQLANFPTTGGEYIESIFTHRQIFFAYPGGHRFCAKAFSDLACSLQRREWRADRDADMEAVSAFNYEAQFIASVIS